MKSIIYQKRLWLSSLIDYPTWSFRYQDFLLTYGFSEYSMEMIFMLSLLTNSALRLHLNGMQASHDADEAAYRKSLDDDAKSNKKFDST